MERRQKMLLSTTTSVFLALICFLLILAISNDFQKSWDVTTDQRHSFSPQTVEFVQRLDQPVKLFAFVDPNGDSSTVDGLLSRYKKLSPRFFSYEIVDLQKKPTLAETLQVRSYGQGVLEKEGDVFEGETPRRERILHFDEATITNAITKLLRGEDKTIYFLTGHGERRFDDKGPQDLSQLVASLRTEGYQAKGLSLAENPEIPADAVLLVVAGPTGELLEQERKVLESYMANQGKLLFLADLATPDSYVDWLSKYGIRLLDSVIVDEGSAQAGAEPVTPIGEKVSTEHPITRMFRSKTAFTLARPIELGEVSLNGRSGQVTGLIHTAESAYLIPLKEILTGKAVTFSAEGKKPASYMLAAAGIYQEVALDPEPPTPDSETPTSLSSRIVVSSSADVFSNAFFGLAGNRDFVLNSINWLGESENQITVRPKDPKLQPISLSKQSQSWLYFIFCLLIPFLSALTGILIAYYRRKGVAT
jgi:gliding motility-associatede transport system auxiliary component